MWIGLKYLQALGGMDPQIAEGEDLIAAYLFFGALVLIIICFIAIIVVVLLGTLVTLIIIGVVYLIKGLFSSFFIIREKEVVIVERLGKFNRELRAGWHLLIPYFDRPKKYWYRYFITSNTGSIRKEESYNEFKILIQNKVLDFPKTFVLTRDNASLTLDSVLNYKITNPRKMTYSCVNLPNMLSKCLQAQLRNVVGVLDVDQLIEDPTAGNIVQGKMQADAERWGVVINWTKLQGFDTMGLDDILSQKKDADLLRKKIIIQAKTTKQTAIIQSEAKRDTMVREAEGEMQEILAKTRGQAQAIINTSKAEARSIKEIAKSLIGTSENPVNYILALKIIDALSKVVSLKGTDVRVTPRNATFLEAISSLGMNSVVPPQSGQQGKKYV